MKSKIKNSPSAEAPVASKAENAERQMEPTPRPWRMVPKQDSNRFWSIFGTGREAEIVAAYLDKDDAALIVQCVNSFEEMKEALKYCADHARPSIVQDVARAALAKVEQQQTQN